MKMTNNSLQRIFNQKGFFNFFEFLIAIAVSLILFSIFLKNITSLSEIAKTKHRNVAYQKAAEKIDDIRKGAAVEYGSLASSGPDTAPDIPLPSATFAKTVETETGFSGSDFNKVTVTISWKEQSVTEKLQMVTYVARNGFVK